MAFVSRNYFRLQNLHFCKRVHVSFKLSNIWRVNFIASHLLYFPFWAIILQIIFWMHVNTHDEYSYILISTFSDLRIFQNLWDFLWLNLLIGYAITSYYVTIKLVLKFNLPCLSTFILLLETVRKYKIHIYLIYNFDIML